MTKVSLPVRRALTIGACGAALLAPAAASAAASATVAASPAAARPAVGCLDVPPATGSAPARFTSNVSIRTGPAAACDTAGVGRPDDDARATCIAPSSGYVHAVDLTTKVQGWVSPNDIQYAGTLPFCLY